MAQRQRKGTPAAKTTGGGNNMFYGVLGVIALGGLVAIGYALTTGGGRGAATELVDLQITDAQALYERATPMRLGRSDAPVKVIEFGDFQCPGCGDFSLRTKPAIVDRFINSGDVQLTYYDFPLVSIHDHAVLAARASRCAGDQELPTPEKLRNVPGEVNAAYWLYHDKLFEEQRDWAYSQGAPVGQFVDYAAELGLDRDAFRDCLRSDRHADVVSANQMLGEQLRLTGTPTVIVNNRRVEDWRAMQLGQVIQQALGSASTGDESGN